MHDAVKMKTRN